MTLPPGKGITVSHPPPPTLLPLPSSPYHPIHHLPLYVTLLRTSHYITHHTSHHTTSHSTLHTTLHHTPHFTPHYITLHTSHHTTSHTTLDTSSHCTSLVMLLTPPSTTCQVSREIHVYNSSSRARAVQTKKSDQKGNFCFMLPPGSYQVEVMVMGGGSEG